MQATKSKKQSVKKAAPAVITGPNKFRSNLKAEQVSDLIARKEDGQKWNRILKETGLSHSKAELAWMEHEAFVQCGFTVASLSPEFVAYCRNDLRIGWGPIMVWTQSSEGKVRKAWEAGGTHSDCKRVGKGGRFKFDDAELYVGELKPQGTDVPADKPLARSVARESAIVTRLLALDPNQVKAIYTKYIGEPKKGTTKAKMVLELKKVNEAQALSFAEAK